MAYVKVLKPAKSKASLQNMLDYIQNSEKTNDKLYVTSYHCMPKTALINFEEEHWQAIKKGDNFAWHFVQSFSPEDGISPETAIEIGEKLMKSMYPNHQYVIGTHIDRGHIHNHIVCNSVNFVTHKKLVSNLKSLEEFRAKSDEICREYGLSIIEPGQKNQREKLQKVIDEAVEHSNDFDDFLKYMQSQNYQVKMGKHIAFKSETGKKFMRTDTIGSAYTELSIKSRIIGKEQVKNKKRRVYDGKYKGMSDRKILKMLIDRAIKKSKTFDDFFKNIQLEKVEIKQRAESYSFRIPQAERFIRLDSLHDEDYTLAAIRKRIEDYEGYLKHKKLQEENKIDRVEKGVCNSKTALKNININLATLNELKKYEIDSYEDLISKIEEIEQLDKKEKNIISEITLQISDKKEIIKAIQDYWKLKPIAEKAVKLKQNIPEYEKYKAENQQEIATFKNCIAIMEKSKIGGKLPKMQDLYNDISRLNEHKDYFVTRNLQTKEKLKNWENIKFNVDNALNGKAEEKSAKQAEIRQEKRRKISYENSL